MRSLFLLLIGLTAACSSYANSGRFAHYANDDASQHPEAKQDIDALMSASNNDATERAVLCIHSVYEAEALGDSERSERGAKVAADIKDPSSFAFAVKVEDKSRSCLKLCAPTPSEEASDEVRVIARKYSDRCRAHFGEIRTMTAD